MRHAEDQAPPDDAPLAKHFARIALKVRGSRPESHIHASVFATATTQRAATSCHEVAATRPSNEPRLRRAAHPARPDSLAPAPPGGGRVDTGGSSASPSGGGLPRGAPAASARARRCRPSSSTRSSAHSRRISRSRPATRPARRRAATTSSATTRSARRLAPLVQATTRPSFRDHAVGAAQPPGGATPPAPSPPAARRAAPTTAARLHASAGEVVADQHPRLAHQHPRDRRPLHLPAQTAAHPLGRALPTATPRSGNIMRRGPENAVPCGVARRSPSRRRQPHRARRQVPRDLPAAPAGCCPAASRVQRRGASTRRVGDPRRGPGRSPDRPRDRAHNCAVPVETWRRRARAARASARCSRVVLRAIRVDPPGSPSSTNAPRPPDPPDPAPAGCPRLAEEARARGG